jgi:cell division protein FtsB
MSKTNPIYAFLSHNKYWLVLIVGVLIVGFFDENSFVQRIKYDMEISELEAQIDKYNAQYERDERQLKELRRNPKAITKIARERYFMKADDEDIFVLSDEMDTQTPLPHETAQ